MSINNVKTCLEVGEKSVNLLKTFKNWRDAVVIKNDYIETAKEALGIDFKTYRIVHNAIKRNGEPREEPHHADVRAMKAITSKEIQKALKHNELNCCW